jgi:hypothetical protein
LRRCLLRPEVARRFVAESLIAHQPASLFIAR